MENNETIFEEVRESLLIRCEPPNFEIPHHKYPFNSNFLIR